MVITFKTPDRMALIAVLTSVSVWTVLDTWSTIGKCERREESLFLTNTSRVWYEGTACTQDQREGHFEEH